MKPNKDDDDQSVSMERSGDDEDEDEESMIPMKRPAGRDNPNDGREEEDGGQSSSFLDDDFLCFSNVDNGGERREVDRRAGGGPPFPDGGSLPTTIGTKNAPVGGGGGGPAMVPWLTRTNDASTPPTRHRQVQQQRQRWGRNNNGNDGDRGYGSIDVIGRDRPRVAPPLVRLHNEMVSFVDLMSPTAEEMRLRERVVERVTGLARATFGDGAVVLPFGSQVTGLCLPGSDVDFVIRLPSTTPPGGGDAGDGTNTAAEAVADNPLRRFADAVLDEFGTRSELLVEDDGGRCGVRDDDYEEDDSDDAEDADADAADGGGGREYLSYLEVIEQTRVPLVKFTIAPHGIDVDVCFDQPHGPESADLMHRFMESMPPLRPLTFVLKYFLASRDINKPFTGGIGSYLLQLMIVSYLQHRAREDVSRRHGADGRHYNLGSLLLDFLELYGVDFNYVTTGISVRHDGYYFPKGLKERRESFWQPSRPFGIAMENPLDPTADVGAGAFRMQMIQRVFGHAFRTLLAYVSEPAEPTDSILARIIPPTEEMERRMIAKRRSVSIVVVDDDGPEDDDEEEDEFGSSDHGGNLGPKRRKTGGKKDRKRRKSNRNDDACDNGKVERSIQGGIQGGGGKKRGKKRIRNST